MLWALERYKRMRRTPIKLTNLPKVASRLADRGIQFEIRAVRDLMGLPFDNHVLLGYDSTREEFRSALREGAR